MSGAGLLDLVIKYPGKSASFYAEKFRELEPQLTRNVDGRYLRHALETLEAIKLIRVRRGGEGSNVYEATDHGADVDLTIRSALGRGFVPYSRIPGVDSIEANVLARTL